ncbi:helix-turn-helix domain-containing protein [Paracoccus yeei]|uniref:helix-turn-helix domain-containing protein n=1 Tax=Paracoccus yeei TaxID=147645 RepID=UPI001C8DA761|nr:helix-turn-helix domain-containing protein [Paracoccus yeei]MBY0137507.1 helix-turn-helix domain-containing protein [Paracoccus yeei]
MKDLAAYHYTESGLDDIWLANGFRFVETSRGRGVSIDNIDGLHEAIGSILAQGARPLTGKEIRFLRNEMDLSQSLLASLIGVDGQTVARWEKGQCSAPGPAERLLRAMYLESLSVESRVRTLLNDLSKLDTAMDANDMLLEISDDEWQPVAA